MNDPETDTELSKPELSATDTQETSLPSGNDLKDAAFESEEKEESLAIHGVTIVAIGASAGGLDAFTDLLRALPENTGMAFVLVQHLDPYHESILADLLANRTAMPVTQVREDTVVEANKLYVIPPNKTLQVCGDTLTLNARGTGIHKPIDAFFISLARERGANAIGVILSGTASDGTLGLKAIKSAGGVTFAQDLTAKFDSMPRSAIAAGVVDFVMAPQQIAAELASIVQHPYYVRREQFAKAQDGPALQKIVTLLRSRRGVDFAQYKQPTIQRRLIRRMVLRKIENLPEYLSLLQNDTSELESLFQDLLINVTEFFRDPEVFESLRTLAFPSILREHRNRETVRIWVPGCSTGEEIYSIAITLMEYMADHDLEFPVLLFGTDVSDRVIDKARAGVYSESIVSTVSPERFKKFFTKVDGGYQINRAIREMCIFSLHNVAKDPPLSRMDLISCRNLLIYLTPPLQKRVISTFGYALQPNGCLILGTSETLGSLAHLFTPVDGERRIFCRKANIGSSAFGLQLTGGSFQPDVPGFAPNYSPNPPAPQPVLPAVEQYIDRLLLNRYSPPAVVIDRSNKIVEMRGDVGRYLISGARDPNQDLIKALHEELRAPVRDALSRAKSQSRTQQAPNAPFLPDSGGAPAAVDITILPIQAPDFSDAWIVLFQQVGAGEPAEHAREVSAGQAPADRESEISHLEQELASTRQYLQAIIEELRSTNEEAQSANEELQSTNEELQTAKEELQSSNEELNTINAEMQSRNSELAQANDDLMNLLSSMNMPIVMVGRDMRIRRFTPVAESVLHLIPSDVGRPILDLQPRINVPNLESILREVVESLVPFEREVMDIEKRLYLMRVRPYRTSDHRIEGAVLQLVDIGDLKRSLEEVRHARDYAEAIIDTISEPLAVLDSSMTIRTVNRSFHQYFRLSREATSGFNLLEAGNGQFRNPALVAEIERSMSQSTPLSGIEIVQDVEALGRRDLSVTVRIIQGLDEQKLILLVFQDVTDNKQAAEARYRRVFESARDGIVIVDAESGEISDVNPCVTSLTGHPRAELIGKKFWDSPLLVNLPQGHASLSRIREQGVVRYPDVHIATTDARILEVEIIGNIYAEGDHRFIQFNLRDLTDRRKFERELQKSARLESIGLLAGGIAHDFNNLLTGVLGNASLVYTNMRPGHPSRPLLKDIQHSAERAALLTRQLLAYAGKGVVLRERLALPEFLPDILHLVQSAVPQTINISFDFNENTPEVDADAGQLQQLCMNLIINAAEAIGNEPGKITISVAPRKLTAENIAADYPGEDLTPGNYALIEVSDTGSGMTDEVKAKIFDPFYTTKFTGRGLGLAAALGIVRQHAGSIHVFSAPGKGTAFQVLLPEAQSPARTQQKHRKSKSKSKSKSGKWGKVLVIEDEPSVLNVACKSLENSGFEVDTATDGRDGVEIFTRDPSSYRIVLLDLLMPGMSGEDTVDAIRAIRADIPILLVSGLDESEAIRRMGNRAVQGFVQKPFTPEWLVQNILAAVD